MGTQSRILTIAGLPKPFPDMPVKKSFSSTASQESLAQVREWLEICQTSHGCLGRVPTTLPKRVIDVSLPTVKLYETTMETGQYACLSHCWGATRPACRTTMANLDENRRAILWEALPATFRDAIDFTRRLGIRYIWIDSICIIQDSAQDWSEQSAQMAPIYGNAFVTLCATASTSDDGGCYLDTPAHLRARKVTAKTRDGTEYDVYVRNLLNHRHLPD